MRVKAIKQFKDLDKDILREVGDEWEVTKERSDVLFKAEVAEEVATKKSQTKKKKGE